MRLYATEVSSALLPKNGNSATCVNTKRPGVYPSTLYDTSARPSRTASNVPGGAATGLGQMLHLRLPLDSCSTASHHFCWLTLAVWWGGNQDETVKTVWAWAAVPASSAAAQRVVRNVMSYPLVVGRSAKINWHGLRGAS